MLLVPRKNNYDLLEDVFNNTFFKETESKVMKTDIYEQENDYIIMIDLPGCKKEDIKIEISEGYLVICANINKEIDETNSKYIRKERYFGQCSRNFFVGEEIEVEDIKASFNNGILKLIVPKKYEVEETIKKYVEIED